jgi:3-hydroxybutyryl-CoA dehydratase
VLAYERVFDVDDVRAFSEVSGDRGVHHVELDQEGRLLVQGLLTATIPTKLGGDIDYLAQEMTFRFHRPVFSGDRIRCECVADVVDDRGDRTYLEFGIRCTNEDGKVVLTGATKGVVLGRR